MRTNRLLPHAKPQTEALIYGRNGVLDMTRRPAKRQPQVEPILLWLD